MPWSSRNETFLVKGVLPLALVSPVAIAITNPVWVWTTCTSPKVKPVSQFGAIYAQDVSKERKRGPFLIASITN